MDRRSRRTRNALTTALMALLKERPLKSITVTELAELADVNRATFYVHFQDVYDMFDQVKEEFCNICRELVDAHGEELARNENRPFLEDIFSYFETNEDAFAIVFGDNADGAFLGDVIDVVRDSCLTAVAPLEAVERRERDQGLTPNRDRALGMALCNYQFDFIAGGIVSMLKSWLASDHHGRPRRQLPQRAGRRRPPAQPRAGRAPVVASAAPRCPKGSRTPSRTSSRSPG